MCKPTSRQKMEKNYGYRHWQTQNVPIQESMNNWSKKKESKWNQWIDPSKFSMQMKQRIEKLPDLHHWKQKSMDTRNELMQWSQI